MYPNGELTLLALRKAALRCEIARLRVDCASAAGRVARPLAWVDRAVDFGRRLSPLAMIAAVPLGMVVQRLIFPRFKFLGTLLRWGPFAFTAVRGLRAK